MSGEGDGAGGREERGRSSFYSPRLFQDMKRNILSGSHWEIKCILDAALNTVMCVSYPKKLKRISRKKYLQQNRNAVAFLFLHMHFCITFPKLTLLNMSEKA